MAGRNKFAPGERKKPVTIHSYQKEKDIQLIPEAEMLRIKKEATSYLNKLILAGIKRIIS